MTAQSDSAKVIFLDAIENRAPEDWPAILDEACAGDAELRAAVEKLLRAHSALGTFHEQLRPTITVDSPICEVPGDIIGPYKLLEQIGEGGFGVVFMAEQSQPVRRKVALKVLKPGMDTRQVIARFEAERQALAIMDHPNIAKVFDGGATPSGRPYFVMELVKGVPITEFCDQNHLTPRQRLELFVPVCQAVQHAHQKGIIHRDLKPSNILISVHDTTPIVKIIDFGIAKALGPELTDKTLFTGIAEMIGTPLYMSPEQAGQSDLDVDTRSDIYSLGVLLYELLTGSTPFTKDRFKQAACDEIRRIIREEEPPKPSNRLSESRKTMPSISANRHTEPAKLTKLVRGELDWIVMKALEKDRNRRYETANGFAMDVQRYLADEPVQACPPSAAYRFGKFARRNKGALATMSVMAVAVLVTTVALAVSNVLITGALAAAKASEQEAKVQESLAKANADKARAQEKIAKQEELTARRRYYAAQTNLAMQAWEAGDPARTLELLETQRPKFDQEDLRSFEWYYLWRLCQSGLRARLNHEADVVAFLPESKTLASTGRGSFKLWDVSSGEKKLQWPVGHLWGLSVSPDGKFLGTWGNSEPTRLWDATSGKQVAVIEGTKAPTFSPDGKLMAVARNADIEFWDLATDWDLATRQPHSPLRVSERGVGSQNWQNSFVFAPDWKTAIVALENNRVRLYRWAGDHWQEGSEISGLGWSSRAAFSPDGETIAVGGTDRKIYIYSADTGKELSALSGHTGNVSAVVFSPVGKYLASAGGDRTVRLWDLATRKQKACYPHKGPVTSVAFAPDGKQLASAGSYEGPRIWDTNPVESPSVLRHSGGVYVLAFTPDGKTLVSGGPYPTQLSILFGSVDAWCEFSVSGTVKSEDSRRKGAGKVLAAGRVGA